MSNDIWQRIAAPLDPTAIAWRQDGRPAERGGKFFARFVCYIEANTVRERLDSVVPGEWSLDLEVQKELMDEGGATVDTDARVAIKARLTIRGVAREDIGVGKDYKQASTDAFKRVAVRFGIGHELYNFEQNWVQVDSDSKYAKPVEDPAVAYARRSGETFTPTPKPAATVSKADVAKTFDAEEVPVCPKCEGPVWDNRVGKRNPKAPDYKCRDKNCDGVIWPPKNQAPAKKVTAGGGDDFEDFPGVLADVSDDLPF